ncbi:TraA protein [Streptomyces massasporeus]|uniref:TraA protein n=1 Tax=Streptomyces massasporeus TaxID=67324 RepID=UPI0033ED5E11
MISICRRFGPGNEWRYLFRGVMVGDGHRPAGTPLRAAQDEADAPPGVWKGGCLAAVGLKDGDVVTGGRPPNSS